MPNTLKCESSPAINKGRGQHAMEAATAVHKGARGLIKALDAIKVINRIP